MKELIQEYKDYRIEYVNANLNYVALNGYKENEDGTVDGAITFEDELAYSSAKVRELINRAVQQVVGLYGKPNCDYLHHKKSHRHGLGEVCPVEQEIINLINKP